MRTETVAPNCALPSASFAQSDQNQSSVKLNQVNVNSRDTFRYSTLWRSLAYPAFPNRLVMKV